MPNATAPVDATDSQEVPETRPNNGNIWIKRVSVITVPTGLAVSWKPFTNSNASATNSARPNRTYGHQDSILTLLVEPEARSNKNQSRNQNQSEDDGTHAARTSIHLLRYDVRNGRGGRVVAVAIHLSGHNA